MPCVVASLKVIVTLTSHASVADGAANTGPAGQLTGVACVTQVITGAVLSVTEIERLQVDELPQSSVALQVLVVVYSWGHVPGVFASANVMVGDASQLSVAVALSNTGCDGHSIGDTTAGQEITGAVLSFTVIV